MKKAKQVSIVIPVYNEEDQLVACLESIALQTVKPVEVIVVDNNSTDHSIDVARQFPFVRILREKQQGIVFARNRGFNAVKGEIIGRIDADSVLPVNWVEHIQRFYADELNSSLAFTGGGNFYDVTFPSPTSWAYNNLIFGFNKLLIGTPTLWGSNMAITKSQWQAMRRQVCSENGLHEDLDLTMHLVNKEIGIYYDNTLKVGASLRRSRTERHELWHYLMWWPNTLKKHGRKAWLVCWLVGGLGVYVMTLALRLIDSQPAASRIPAEILRTEHL